MNANFYDYHLQTKQLRVSESNRFVFFDVFFFFPSIPIPETKRTDNRSLNTILSLSVKPTGMLISNSNDSYLQKAGFDQKEFHTLKS